MSVIADYNSRYNFVSICVTSGVRYIFSFNPHNGLMILQQCSTGGYRLGLNCLKNLSAIFAFHMTFVKLFNLSVPLFPHFGKRGNVVAPNF